MLFLTPMTKTEWWASSTFIFFIKFMMLYQINFCNWKQIFLKVSYLHRFKIDAHEYHAVSHLNRSCRGDRPGG